METKNERTRKERKNGERTQKLMSFRLDNDLAEWLQTKVNKGRLINELLRRQREAEGMEADCAEMPTDPEDELK